MRTRVKICGITRAEDAQAASAHGADAIGLIFYRPSPRYVTLERARQLVEATPAFVSTVAVFVNPSREEVESVIRECGVTLLQFHGDEGPEFCSGFSRPYIKAARIRPELDLLKYLSPHKDARAWMLDAFHWSLVPLNAAKPVILSGGLTSDNVAAAVKRVRPYAVDVSTGVEASKGIKDAAKIAAFIGAVRREDS